MAAVAAVSGGVAVKIFDRWVSNFDRNKRISDLDQGKFRLELWGEIHKLREEVSTIRDEVDAWREKYYQLVAENLSLEKRVSDLTSETEILRGRINTQNKLIEFLRSKIRCQDGAMPDDIDID